MTRLKLKWWSALRFMSAHIMPKMCIRDRECGMRFLADYLEGDHYFHINYETQNLNRARTKEDAKNEKASEVTDKTKVTEQDRKSTRLNSSH